MFPSTLFCSSFQQNTLALFYTYALKFFIGPICFYHDLHHFSLFCHSLYIICQNHSHTMFTKVLLSLHIHIYHLYRFYLTKGATGTFFQTQCSDTQEEGWCFCKQNEVCKCVQED